MLVPAAQNAQTPWIMRRVMEPRTDVLLLWLHVRQHSAVDRVWAEDGGGGSDVAYLTLWKTIALARYQLSRQAESTVNEGVGRPRHTIRVRPQGG